MPNKTLSRKMLEVGAVPLSQIPEYDRGYASERMKEFMKTGRKRKYAGSEERASPDLPDPNEPSIDG